MKNSILLFLIFLFVTSCNKTDKLSELENRITNIENKILVDNLDSVNSEFIKPFKVYEKIVLSELSNSPNQIISDYEFLIKEYPNSFWKHEAKKELKTLRNGKNTGQKKMDGNYLKNRRNLN
ncbi:MAG: hypothetical protein NWQ07_04400 [Flaviramulus sp.]|nr:hypothetical protein [Flaviramulus sp.]